MSRKFSMVNFERNFASFFLSASSACFTCSDLSLEMPPTLCESFSSAIRSFLASLMRSSGPEEAASEAEISRVES